jgi:hypothetical protein
MLRNFTDMEIVKLDPKLFAGPDPDPYHFPSGSKIILIEIIFFKHKIN